ncbi:hypothetical protein [Fictibacillus barbaricus]|uniref:Permuted papain-like amidase enzyme, YaeF/YiiX, C92 family n=1 Tax=Fictibacillus barbaricus TaxID=182136 RepID=A0ABS2Z9X6_9BACL|nr:hypothetical protein [Fictibacillus barbaricus]MBN3544123.1 hypothetical protein [Fictibacillus barbaricus]GGB69127.1 hypothetical protein GCM10007199_39150 [Fictibacillus barbaricus]
MEIYIVLTDTKTLFTKVISKFTNHPLNHASISFDKKLIDVYSFGRKEPNNPFIGGFVKENMQNKLFKRSYCKVYRCKVTPFQYKLMQSYILRIEKEQKNFKYNFRGLFGVILNKEFEQKNAFFCSEFVAKVLNVGGIPIIKKSDSLMTPYDISCSTDLHLFYQGPLIEYPFYSQTDHVPSSDFTPISQSI